MGEDERNPDEAIAHNPHPPPMAEDISRLTDSAIKYISSGGRPDLTSFHESLSNELLQRIAQTFGSDQLIVISHIYRATAESLLHLAAERRADNIRSRLKTGVPAFLRYELDLFEEDYNWLRSHRRQDLGTLEADLFSIVENCMDAMLRGAETLTADDEMAKAIGDLTTSYPIQGNSEAIAMVRALTEVKLARDAVDRLDEGANRVLHLARLVGGEHPSPRARAFIRRVSKCYIAGFDNECGILCRATLDAEFAVEISDEECDAHYGASGLAFRRHHDLNDRINAAFYFGRIDKRIHSIAHRIKNAGNDRVHHAPVQDRDSFPLIKDTRDVLSALAVSRLNGT